MALARISPPRKRELDRPTLRYRDPQYKGIPQ